MANGANSKWVLREYLLLQYLGADDFQGRQAPTCKVFFALSDYCHIQSSRRPCARADNF